MVLSKEHNKAEDIVPANSPGKEPADKSHFFNWQRCCFAEGQETQADATEWFKHIHR